MDLQQVFFNLTGRLRSGWRLLIFFGLYILFLFLFGTAARVIYAIAIQTAPGVTLGGYVADAVFRVIILASALLAGLICTRWLERLPWRAIGLSLHEGWLRDFLVGSIIGIASLALATGIATAGGGLRFTVSSRGMLLQVGQTLVFSAIIFIVAALAEEVMFRGYPLQTMTRAGLFWLGALLTSVSFVAIHLGNPNLKWGLPILNLGLAGVWFAIAFWRTRSLWFPLGIHWAWNWALGSLFGLPVSGITEIAPQPLLQGSDLGPAWLTGGSFGIEGGVACTITLVVSTVFVWWVPWVSATDEMRRLTSHDLIAAELSGTIQP